MQGPSLSKDEEEIKKEISIKKEIFCETQYRVLAFDNVFEKEPVLGMIRRLVEAELAVKKNDTQENHQIVTEAERQLDQHLDQLLAAKNEGKKEEEKTFTTENIPEELTHLEIIQMLLREIDKVPERKSATAKGDQSPQIPPLNAEHFFHVTLRKYLRSLEEALINLSEKLKKNPGPPQNPLLSEQHFNNLSETIYTESMAKNSVRNAVLLNDVFKTFLKPEQVEELRKKRRQDTYTLHESSIGPKYASSLSILHPKKKASSNQESSSGNISPQTRNRENKK